MLGTERVTVVGDLVFNAPELYVKNLSGRQVDLHIPVQGTIKVGELHFQLGKDTLLIPTVSLTRIESTLQDRQEGKQTRYDLIVDLTSPDVLLNLVLESTSGPDLAFLIKVLKHGLCKRRLPRSILSTLHLFISTPTIAKSTKLSSS